MCVQVVEPGENEADDTGSLYDLEPADDGAFRMGKPPFDWA